MHLLSSVSGITGRESNCNQGTASRTVLSPVVWYAHFWDLQDITISEKSKNVMQ
jgi:hypothetical protein